MCATELKAEDLPLDDICNRTGVHEQAFWHLQGHCEGIVLADVVDGFVDLE